MMSAKWEDNRLLRWISHPAPTALYDRQLVWLSFGLMMVGLIMVSSASIPVSTRLVDEPFHFAMRQGFYLIGALILAGFALQIPLARWQQLSIPMLLISFALLVAVLLVGRSVMVRCAGCL